MDFVFIPIVLYDDVELCLVDTEPNKIEFSIPPSTALEDLENDIQIETAHPVSVIGYPFGLFEGSGWPLWATGFIASEPDRSDKFRQLIIDCRSREGQSGAPVYVKQFGHYRTQDGRDVFCDGNVYSFVGVYTGRINEQSDLGIVWTAESINEAAIRLRPDNWAPLPDDTQVGGPLPKI